VVRAMTGRTMTVPVSHVIPWQEPVKDRQEIVVRPGTDLYDHEPGRGVRHEDRQQPVGGTDVGEERSTFGGEIRQPAARSGPDGKLARVYGKMLRRASRSRPRPPRAGADS
jgi:hypothetical protein